MNELERVAQFQRLIKPAQMSAEEVFKLYATKLAPEEIGEALTAENKGNKVKEACDVIVVLIGLDPDAIKMENMNFSDFLLNATINYLHLIVGCTANRERALKAVNDSNFSKLVLKDELDSELAYFKKLGIEVYTSNLDDQYLGIYSAKNQTVNDKKYTANKLLKPSKYAPVDESINFWGV